MPSCGIVWYRPYSSPSEFFNNKVHSYNDISRLISNNPERVIGLSNAIESFIDNERFDTIDSSFVNNMIMSKNPHCDSIVSKYIKHQIDKIATEGLSKQSDCWTLWTELPYIKNQYKLGKVTESAATIYNNALHNIADRCAANLTYMDSTEIDRVTSKFGTEITYESMLNWDNNSIRDSIVKSDPMAANIGDIIFNLSNNELPELVMESLLFEKENIYNKIVETVKNPYVDIEILEQIYLDIPDSFNNPNEFVDSCVKSYIMRAYGFSPQVYQWIISKLYSNNLLKCANVINIDEAIDTIASAIIDRENTLSYKATESIENDIALHNAYGFNTMHPGMNHHDAVIQYQWLNRAYNNILGRTDEDSSNINDVIEEKINDLKKYLEKLNWCARTNFQFTQWTDYGSPDVIDENIDESQETTVEDMMKHAETIKEAATESNDDTEASTDNNGPTKTGTYAAGANQEKEDSKEYHERAEKNDATDAKSRNKRLLSEAKFKRQTSNVTLAYSQYKRNAQDADLKITNALKDFLNTVTVGSNSKEMRREIIEGKTYSVTKLLKTFLGGYLVFCSTKIGFILLLIVRSCRKGKVRRSEKKKIIMELEGELSLIEEKIRDASADCNNPNPEEAKAARAAKYSLMRTKANLENAIKRIKMNTEMDKYSAGSARNVTVNDQRA